MSFLCLLGVSALSVCSLCVSAQQRMCEQLTRVVDIVAGLPPFQATFEKAPVSERLVIVMALGPYAQVQSDTSGHVRAQFSKFASANSADLLRLSLRCPLPGLMLQAAQLAKTQIEEFILNCHQAGQKWDCVCLVDEIFDVGASHMSVFHEVPENSVLITQPHLCKDQTRPTNALPSYPSSEWRLVPLGHWNWKWNQARSIYSTYDQELLAGMLVLSLQSRIMGSNPIVWLCDQEPVKSFQKGPPPEKAKLKRWWTYLSQFRLTVHHIPGIKDELSDYISRNNFDALIGASSEALAKVAFQRMGVQLDLSMRTAGTFENWSLTDYQSEYKEILQTVSTGLEPRVIDGHQW